MELSALVPVKNRPGVFAVMRRDAAERIANGYMQLFERGQQVVVESITRNRWKITDFDPNTMFVMVAIDPNGLLVIST
jgi:hypothetical protein